MIKMRNIFLLIFLVISAFCLSQSHIRKKQIDSINIANVDSVVFYKLFRWRRNHDSTIFIAKKLNQTQILTFAEVCNAAKYKNVCDLNVKYTITIYLKDGSSRRMEVGKRIKENRNYCFEFKNKRSFDRIWKAIKVSRHN